MSITKHTIWILVDDAARARVFRLEGRKRRLEPAWGNVVTGPRLPSREIASDRPGRTFDSAGEGRHAKEPPTDPARYEKRRFAREITRMLDDDRKQQAFDSLIVVAPPQFLGDLRTAMPAELAQCVTAEINKDLSKLKPVEILDHLSKVV